MRQFVTMRRLLTIAAITFLLPHAAGQTGGRAAGGERQTAIVEGDAYLVMKSGDTKPGAGRTVFLLRDTPELRSGVAGACSAYAARIAQITDSFGIPRQALKDSADAARQTMQADVGSRAKLNRWKELSERHIKSFGPEIEANAAAKAAPLVAIRTLISAAVSDSAGTGMNAHFRFGGVKPGPYILFAEWEIGGNKYQWWAPVILSPGQSLKRDLDNSVEADGKLFCGIT